MSDAPDIMPILVDMAQTIGDIQATSRATLEQAKKTNGRVTALEERADKTDERLNTQAAIAEGELRVKIATDKVKTRRWNRAEAILGIVAMFFGGGIVGEIAHHFGVW